MRSTSSTDPEPLITMAEVAIRLGEPLKTFRRWRDHRQAPLGFRMGGHVVPWRDAHREVEPLTGAPAQPVAS